MLGTNYSHNLNPLSVSILVNSTHTAADTSTLTSKVLKTLLTFSMATIDGFASVAGGSSVPANQKCHGIVTNFDSKSLLAEQPPFRIINIFALTNDRNGFTIEHSISGTCGQK